MNRIHCLIIASLLFVCSMGAQQFPCKQPVDYKIRDKNTLLVLCDAAVPTQIDATGSLFLLVNESIVHGSEINGTAKSVVDTDWLVFTFQSALEGGKDYELQFAGKITIQVGREQRSQAFKDARFRITTKPTVQVWEPPGVHHFVVDSHVALDLTTLGAGKISQKNSSGKFEDTHATFLPQAEQNTDSIGQVNIPASPRLTGPPFLLEGLKDVFGQALVADPTKHAPPISVPKSKTDANYYINFLQQAGWGITPTWVADVKIAPVLGRPVGGWFLAPSFLADVGSGSVGDTKATDLIKPSIGATRLFSFDDSFIQGIGVIPSFSYETDRENDKRNALFDGDLRFYLRGFSKTKAESSLQKLLAARKKEVGKDAKDMTQADDPSVKANFGYSVQLFLGAEAGGALMAVTAQSSDKSSKVVVPTYTIARLRPRATTTLEYKAVTLNLSAVPRYLFTTEDVTRQILVPKAAGSAKEKIYLDTVSGWRPYGEVSAKVALDPVGHFALNATYKVGSQPANFNKTNLFQTGLLMVY
jgi:hypothetical protein